MAEVTDGVFKSDGIEVEIPEDVWVIDKASDVKHAEREPMSELPPHLAYEMTHEQKEACAHWHGYYPVPDDADYTNERGLYVVAVRHQDMQSAGWWAEIIDDGGTTIVEHYCAGEKEAIKKAISIAQKHHLPLLSYTERLGI